MHGARFFGCVCVRMHSCTYTCAQFMDGGQKTAFRSHFSHIMFVPGSISGGQYCGYTFTHQAVLLAHVHFSFVIYALGVTVDDNFFYVCECMHMFV